jgi:hypothetical protein
VFDWGGWAATCALLAAMSSAVLALSLYAERRWQAVKPD